MVKMRPRLCITLGDPAGIGGVGAENGIVEGGAPELGEGVIEPELLPSEIVDQDVPRGDVDGGRGEHEGVGKDPGYY